MDSDSDLSEREAELVEEMRRVASIVEGTPRAADLEEHGELPLYRYNSTFGSLTLAQLAAGLPPNNPGNLPEELLLAELDAVCEEAGRSVTAREFEDRSLFTARVYSHKFGTWNAAIRETGREPQQDRTPREDLTRDDVVEAIREVGEELEHAPSRREVIERTDLTKHYLSAEFDDYATLVKEAGFEPGYERS